MVIFGRFWVQGKRFGAAKGLGYEVLVILGRLWAVRGFGFQVLALLGRFGAWVVWGLRYEVF